MIGLFGGTFDPIHGGHIHLAKQLLKKYPFKKILFIPNAQNPLKTDSAKVAGELRAQMIEAAFNECGEPKFEVSRVEVDRPAPSYMIDTVDQIRKQTKEPLSLIVGNEVFRDIAQWKEAKRLLETVSVIVVKRENKLDLNVKELFEKLHISARSDKSPKIEEFETEILDLSSTEMRKRLKEAWKKDHLETPVPGVQRSVCLLIKVHQLYAR